MTETTATQDLVITRVFDAPRELVYRAFTDPEQLAAWFGPVGWSVPRKTVDIDARVGGHQRFTMVDDSDPSMTSAVDATFTEVIENELLVGIQQVDFGAGEVAFELRLEFHDEGGKTRLAVRQGPYTQEMEGQAREGWNSSFGKLDALLAG
jgi:uncharacterized protein YndB with AHSA1/START domain